MLNKETFIKNLSEITTGMKQKEIASIMGCSEGTISKYLNPDKKDFPAVEMLYNIREHFHVSIDWLIGATSNAELQTDKKLSARDICQMIVNINKTQPLNFATIKIEEWCGVPNPYTGTDAEYEQRENTYLGIYIPNWFITDDWDIWDMNMGNENSKAIEINAFLSRLQKIDAMRKKGDLDEEMYDILLNKYLADVSN